jgi:glycosyltransferase involved in cell wall biosynthesis
MPNNDGPIKLLIFIHELAPFGAQRVALGLAENLDRGKFKLTVCSFGGDETLGAAFEACGAEVILLRARRYLDLSAWLKFSRLIFSLRPDIVQTNLAELSVPARLLSVFLPAVKIIHTVQNPLSSEPVYWRFLNRLTLFLCDLVIFCSESMSSADALTRGFAPESCVIQNGVRVERAAEGEGAALRRELGIPAGDKVVVCVGRLAGQKGQDILIEALAILSAQVKSIRLLLAGDGETLPELKKLAARLGVAGRVFFLGRRADVPRVIAACDVYAAPSRWEGLNIALAEAMLCGVPCVGASISGQADILKDGVTGVAVPPESPELLAKAITWLLDNPAGALKLSSAAREFIKSGFRMEKMAGMYQEKYIALMEKGK